jgi:hypothetical protein
VAVKAPRSRRDVRFGTVNDAWRREMGSRDRPHKETKKKPKDKSAQPHLAPLSEPPQQVEVIRKQRKPRWDEQQESSEG